MKIKTGIVLWLTLVIVIVSIAGISMSQIVSDYFKSTILQRDVDVNAKFIALQARQHLTPDDFTPKDFTAKDKTFQKFFGEINTDEIVLFKVWSTDKTIVYSDNKDEVGKTFSDNDELNDALGGEVKSEISDLSKSENVDEKNYKQLIEIYVPIKSNSGNVIGVIETYASMDHVNAYIANANLSIFLNVMIGIGFVGLVIVLAFRTFRKNLINPIVGIHNQTKKIQEGDLDIKSESSGYDEVKKLGNEVEVMATKLKEQQIRITKAERLSAIGELAARLAHDLRNPLSVIKNSLLLIRNKYGSIPNSIAHFDRIDRSVSRMSHQLENVMDFVTTRELQMDKRSLNEIIQNSIEKAILLEPIKVNLPERDITLVCDSSKLEIAFDNILVNAKQAMNGIGTIDIRTSQEANGVKIEFQDSGPGIPQNVLANIFEPLFTTKQEGTGLGLTSCKNIVEQHGGKISVISELGKGTTFVITLPNIPVQEKVPVTV
ncbi:MAG: hypothetical protein KGI28_01520 [Thaumarchaeota archaeon]|nr:hypothetical protein [Nitrososphaerota archaeon]